jgi:hypothetical protein
MVGMGLGRTADAAPVTVDMHLNSFTGDVGSDFQFVTYFDQGTGPQVVCPDAGCNPGIGVANVALAGGSQIEFWSSTFGVDSTHNFIQFVSSGENDAELGEEFLLGTLTYTNGIWFTDPEFSVTFTTSSLDPAFNNFTWTDTIHLEITTNLDTNTPEQNADFIHLVTLPTLGSIRAYELADTPINSNSVTVEVYGTINSLHLTRFANATGGGFLDPGIDPQPTPTNTVPEPGTLALLSAGLAGLCLRRATRTKLI